MGEIIVILCLRNAGQMFASLGNKPEVRNEQTGNGSGAKWKDNGKSQWLSHFNLVPKQICNLVHIYY